MDFALNEEQRILRDEIIRFAKKELNEGVRERDQQQTFRHDLWLKCGDMGLQGLSVPESLGGIGLDPLSTAIALEALGYGCEDGGLTFAVCAHLLACVVPIWKHGSADQHNRYLPDLCTGRLIAVNAMTEPGTGSDPFSMSTTAVPDDPCTSLPLHERSSTAWQPPRHHRNRTPGAPCRARYTAQR